MQCGLVEAHPLKSTIVPNRETQPGARKINIPEGGVAEFQTPRNPVNHSRLQIGDLASRNRREF
jgi:hypothetical protein